MGAFPGHTLDDIQSGRGKVHNSFMLEKTERTVIEAPFRPFPRSLWHGELTLMPCRPFITHRGEAAQRLVDFTIGRAGANCRRSSGARCGLR